MKKSVTVVTTTINIEDMIKLRKKQIADIDAMLKEMRALNAKTAAQIERSKKLLAKK